MKLHLYAIDYITLFCHTQLFEIKFFPISLHKATLLDTIMCYYEKFHNSVIFSKTKRAEKINP